MALCVFAAGAILYAYAGYPLLLWIISRFKASHRATCAEEPTISVIIAAHNEGSGIRAKLEQTLALDYPRDKTQIIVASDGSTDGTDAIVREFADRGVELVEVSNRLGKTNAQNIAVRRARNSILIFSDATTLYDSQALRHLAAAYCGPRVGAVSGRYDYCDPAEASPTASGSTTFWSLENWIKGMQSRISTISGCCGCIYSVRRDLYTELRPEIISDLVQPLHVLLQRHRVVFEERARAWEVATSCTSEEFRMRVRVATRGMKGLLSVASLLQPWRHPWISFQLWSHKIVRWCIPFFLLCFLVGSVLMAANRFSLILLGLQLSFYAFALASALLPWIRHSRLLSLPLYFCTINSAFLLGFLSVIRGHQYAIWQPTRR